MDSPVTNALKQAAGFGVGTLAALTTIKSGGLGNYIMQRQRMLQDPSFRASLEGSPFTSGFFGVTGSTGAAPALALPQTAAGGAVAQPSDMVGPPAPGQQVAAPAPAGPGQLPAPTAMNVPGYEPGTARTWHPFLAPYAPKAALEEQGYATLEQYAAGGNDLQRGLAKTAGGIMPTLPETNAVLGRAAAIQHAAGPGSTAVVDFPGMKVQLGSPYNLTAMGTREYATPGEALANALPGEQVVATNRGTFTPMPTKQPTATEGYPTAPGAPATTAGGTSGVAAPGTNQAQPATGTVTPPPGAPATAPRPGTAGGAVAPRPAAPVAQPATSSVAPPSAPAAVAPPLPPPPRPVAPAPPPPAPAYVPPGVDPNAVAPSRPVPAAPPPRVGFPSPAPAEAKPDLQTQIPIVQPPAPPTRIVAPPVQPTPPPQGPSTLKTDPDTGVPLQKVTRKYQSGEEETFGATPIRNPEVRLRLREVGITNPDLASPAQIAAYEQDELSDTQRLEIAKSDIQRLRQGQSETEAAATQTLFDYRNNLNKFLEDFPNAADRDQYIGWINRPYRDFLEHFRQDPKFQAFVADLARFQERFFER